MCGSWLRYCRSAVSCYSFPIVGSCSSQAMTCAAISLSCGWLRCRGLHKGPSGVGANRPCESAYLLIQATSNFPCQGKLRGACRPHHCCGTVRERRHALGGEESVCTATETPQTGWTTFTTADVFCASRRKSFSFPYAFIRLHTSLSLSTLASLGVRGTMPSFHGCKDCQLSDAQNRVDLEWYTVWAW